MLRRILAVIAGIVVFVVVVSVMDAISHQLHPMPEGLSMEDMDGMAAFIADAPFGAMFVVMLGWIIGAFGGCFTAAKIAVDQHRLVAGIVGALAFAGTAMNLFMLPHPLWMTIGGLLGITVGAHLGWKLGEGRQGV